MSANWISAAQVRRSSQSAAAERARRVSTIASDGEASRLLDNTQPFVMTGRNLGATPRTWNPVPFASFTSFRAMNSALRDGSLPRGTKGIM
jgi:hypothetical protein